MFVRFVSFIAVLGAAFAAALSLGASSAQGATCLRGPDGEVTIVQNQDLLAADTGEGSTTSKAAGTIPAPDCGGAGPVPPACSNGLDDDGDGYTDMSDLGCASSTDNDEYNPPPAPAGTCSNGRDDDADGKIDLADYPDCAVGTDNEDVYTPPAPAPFDSDYDGVADYQDNCGKSGTPLVSNPNQADDDRNGIGNACDDVWALNGTPESTNSSGVVPVSIVGGDVTKFCGYANGQAVYKTLFGLKTLWRFYASLQVCIAPFTEKVLSMGFTSERPANTFTIWGYDNNARWSFGPTGFYNSWAQVQASFTGCPIFVSGVACRKVTVTIRFSFYGRSYSTNVSFG